MHDSDNQTYVIVGERHIGINQYLFFFKKIIILYLFFYSTSNVFILRGLVGLLGERDGGRASNLLFSPLTVVYPPRTQQHTAMAMGAAVRAAAADGVVTFLWVLCVSTLGASTAAVTTYLSLHEGIHYALLVTVSILTLLLFAFNLLCDALGGASFNPTGVAAFYAAGLTNPSLFSIALRLPAQVCL
jgi:hypothetical protein